MSFGNFGFSEILIIAVIVLIFFGPRRMPEIGRAVGGALREFRRGLNEIQRELQEAERAAKIDPDAPSAKPGGGTAAGASASKGSKPTSSESPESELPTPLAAAMASPSEPRRAVPDQAETGPSEPSEHMAVEEAHAAVEEADTAVEGGADDAEELSISASEKADEPAADEADSERA